MNLRRCGRVLAAALVAFALLGLARPVAAGESTRAPKAGNFVAEATGGSVSVYAKRGDPTATHTFANPTATDGRLVFLVERLRTDGWMKVLLPIRPNGSRGWISDTEVQLKYNPYRLEVDLTAHELTLYKQKDVVRREPVGIGKSTTPTPGGRYYITQLFEPPDPNGPYGPFAYALSGYSEVLTSFRGGEAIVGIHGTNRPDLIGQDLSSGCIRMHNDAIRELRALLPLGTPVTIVE
jgi:lipoprotein-anchoring transpeptidase ErfK/SrfK